MKDKTIVIRTSGTTIWVFGTVYESSLNKGSVFCPNCAFFSFLNDYAEICDIEWSEGDVAIAKTNHREYIFINGGGV